MNGVGWRVFGVFATLVALVLLFTVVLPVSSDGPCWDNAQRCDDVNQLREDHGRKALEQRHGIQKVADLWAESMALSGVLKHNPDLAAQTIGLVGENVGYGVDWQTVRRAFMESPPHRRNILDPEYSEIGIGAQRDGNIVWIVLVFQ